MDECNDDHIPNLHDWQHHIHALSYVEPPTPNGSVQPTNQMLNNYVESFAHVDKTYFTSHKHGRCHLTLSLRDANFQLLFLIWHMYIEYYVVRCEPNNIYHEDTCLKEVGLHLQFVLTILHFMVNTFCTQLQYSIHMTLYKILCPKYNISVVTT